MSINKHLADFGQNQKTKAFQKKGINEDFIDDSRSDNSYMSSSQYSVGASSNFSSALKKPPAFLPHQNESHQYNEKSDISSQISYEEGFPNAEYHALAVEEKAKRRKEDKEQKMKEFMSKTKKSA